ncbi:protein kibra isoform X2 [Vespula squamosa]|uniref:Protein kibra isoform X2 n=1 Tax=Vespula squamosa TaxID=30214 RepID=A0ABD2BMX3_VESSQ
MSRKICEETNETTEEEGTPKACMTKPTWNFSAKEIKRNIRGTSFPMTLTLTHVVKVVLLTYELNRFTKPQTFADCIGNELPLGWEEAYDKHVGAYYINHVNQTTQLEDPRQEWRAIQEAMLREYLQTAQDVLEEKKENEKNTKHRARSGCADNAFMDLPLDLDADEPYAA